MKLVVLLRYKMSELTTSLLEKFILLENKRDILNDVTPHTSLHKFIDVMIDLNSPAIPIADVEKKVQELSILNKNSVHIDLANCKLILRKVDEAKNNQEKLKKLAEELNNKYFRFQFNYDNQFKGDGQDLLVDEEQSKISSALNQAQLEEMGLQAAIKEVYRLNSLDPLSAKYHHKLDVTKFDLTKYFNVVDTILTNHKDINSIKGLKDILGQIVKLRGYSYIVSNIWPKLTLKQKEELIDPMCTVYFCTDLFAKFVTEKFELYKINDEDVSYDQKIRILTNALSFANKSQARYNQFKRGLHQKILFFQEKIGKVDKAMFIEYLKEPFGIRSSWFQETFTKKKISERGELKEENLNSMSIFDSSDDELIRKCLVSLFREKESYEQFECCLDSYKLKKLYFQEKTFQGENCPNLKDYFSESELQSMFTKRELQFKEDNKKIFKQGDKVEIGMTIKNISKLVVRIFEVNTLNFILENKNKNYETIDVSGLIPSGEFDYKYTHNAIVSHDEKFEFHNIEASEKGVFIVDFIGEEIKTRCVITKGQLNLIYEKYHGRSCLILDQNGVICKGKGTGIYIKSVFFEADANTGVIHIPVNIAAINEDVITIHNGFANLCKLITKDPVPEFSTNILYNSENFIAGNKVNFVIEPKLTLYNHYASLSLVSNFQVSIVTTNDQGVQSKTDFKDLKLSENKDVTVDLIFPPKVTNISISIQADVNIKKEPVKVNSNHFVPIQRNDQNEIYSLYFQTDKFDNLKLQVIGKNGEKRKKMLVNFKIYADHRAREYTQKLVTDENGTCVLGKIENLYSVSASCGSVTEHYKNCNNQTISYPALYVIQEHEDIKIPINPEIDVVTFFAYGNDKQLKEEVPKTHYTLANKALNIKGLDEGKYRLRINDDEIELEVIRGQIMNHDKRLLWTQREIFTLDEKPEVWFQSRRETDDAYEFEVKSEKRCIKARLLTYNYLPDEYVTFKENSNGLLPALRFSMHNVESYSISQDQNIYGRAIKLNEELVYVYDRKQRTNFMGNTLEKPGIILKRTKVGDTSETDGDVRACGAESSRATRCADVRRLNSMNQPQLARKMPLNKGLKVKEFIERPGQLIVDLEVKDGVIRVPKALINDYSYSFLSVSDGKFSSFLPVANEEKSVALKDCTLQKSRKDGYIYAYSREVKFLLEKTELKVENISNTQLYIITCLKDLFDAYQTLCKNSGINFTEWSFLHEWDKLEPMDKLKKYDKYACHEFNLFLSLKDPEFFVDVVKPFLINKKEKTIVDFFLLGDVKSCEQHFNIGKVNNSNLLEKILLAVLAKKTHPQFSQAVVNLFKSSAAVNKLPIPEMKTLFETLLNVNSDSITRVGPPAPPSAPGQAPSNRLMGQPMMMRQEMSNIGQISNFSAPMAMMSNMAPAPRAMRYMDSRSDEMERGMLRNVQNECAIFDMDDAAIYQNEVQTFTQAKGTVEYKEKQYHDGRFNSQLNDFWSDLLSHMISNDSNKNFGSKGFLKSVTTLSEFIVALSFVDLPFAKAKIESQVVSNTLHLNASSNVYVLTKEVIEKKGETKDLEVLCSQKIYDPKDPVIYDEEDSEIFYDKPVDEYLPNKVYSSRVVITNSTTTRIKVNLIIEIPEGSMPVDSLDVLQIKDFIIDQFQSQVVEYSFYFPKTGIFNLFSATVVSNGKIVSNSKKINEIVVKTEKSKKDLKTMSDVLSNGKIEDIIEFIKSKNLLNRNIFQFNQIYCFLKNKTFYEKMAAICEEKGIWDTTVWGFAFLHGDYKRMCDVVSYYGNGKLDKLTYHQSDFLKRDNFTIKEYYPLINPRAHVLGSASTNIINDTFKKTYEEFLMYLFQKYNPTVDDYVLLINYLIAQDQIEKGLEITKRIKEDDIKSITTKIQFDYQTAYLNFITGYPDFNKADVICEKYLTYPVLSVRNLFVEMANQLSEFKESEILRQTEKKLEGEALNKQKQNKTPTFSSSLEGHKIKLVSNLVGDLNIKFYKVEAEVIFSLNPFSFESKKAFTYVSPFYEATVKTNDEQDVVTNAFEIPETIRNENLFIEIRANNEKLQKSEFVTYVPFKLNCVVSKEFGIIKCFNPENNKPVPKIYVKCFAKYNNGSIKFYKDGYTDLRGSFDYVSLNSDKIDNIDSFAMLVTSAEYGSKVLTEKPPQKIGTTEGEAKKLISKDWEQRREKNIHLQQQTEMLLERGERFEDIAPKSKKANYKYLY